MSHSRNDRMATYKDVFQCLSRTGKTHQVRSISSFSRSLGLVDV